MRGRLQEGDIFNRFMDRLLNRESVKLQMSDEHFSVDGTHQSAADPDPEIAGRNGIECPENKKSRDPPSKIQPHS